MKRIFAVVSLLLANLLTACTGVAAEESPAAPAFHVYRDKVTPHWFADATGATNRFWYRVDLASNQCEFVLIDAAQGTRAPAFDHARLAQALSKETGEPVDAAKLPFSSLEFSPDGNSVKLITTKQSWLLDLKSYSLTRVGNDLSSAELPAGLEPHPSAASTDETEITFVNHLRREVDLFWIDADGKRQAYGSLKPDESRQQHTYVGHVWLVAAKNGRTLAVFEAQKKSGLAVIDRPANGARPVNRDETSGPGFPEKVPSPDGKWEVSLNGGNLILRDLQNGADTQLTYDANPELNFSRDVDGERSVGMNYDTTDPVRPTPEIYWSPDSSHFVAMKWKRGTQRRVYEVESSPSDQLQPKLISFPYLKPGDDVPYAKPHLFDVAAKKEIPVDDALFSNPWSIDTLRWSPDSHRFTFLYNQRGHQALRILGVDAATGAVKPIVNEESKTFICYSAKFFSEYLDETDEIIWMSERDGWNHLYLYDAKTGQVKNQITKGDWVVLGVDWVDHDKRQIWFHAGGLDSAQDPYYVQYCRINFDGTGLTRLTDGDGTHSVDFSPDRRFLIDTYSRVDLPPVTDLRSAADGHLVCHLETADASELYAAGWQTPRRFVAKGRDGQTDIYGIIVFPRHFDASKKYPVLEEVYAGPQDSFTPKKFYPAGQAYMQKIADHGFIVVQSDGMGTSNRSKKFHDVCWKNLADGGFPDRILWIKAAAATLPSMDLTRVGIYGTSAGGQDALRGMLDHGDFYQACVSDSGCQDNRMDKIWWNEQWMGWPVDDSYARCSNVVDAHKLQGKLLLMVGEMDNNVDPSSTMQVVNALIKADKDFELLDMPGAGHGVAYTPYGQKRLIEFFTRTLHAAN